VRAARDRGDSAGAPCARYARRRPRLNGRAVATSRSRPPARALRMRRRPRRARGARRASGASAVHRVRERERDRVHRDVMPRGERIRGPRRSSLAEPRPRRQTSRYPDSPAKVTVGRRSCERPRDVASVRSATHERLSLRRSLPGMSRASKRPYPDPTCAGRSSSPSARCSTAGYRAKSGQHTLRGSRRRADPSSGAEERHGARARPERFELPTFGSVDRRSIQLSYGRRARQSRPSRLGL